MRKLFNKIKILFLIIITNFIMFSSIVYADDTKDPMKNPDYFKPGSLTDAGKVEQIGNAIIGGIQLLGTIISVVTLIGIGIKFIYGSVEERAEYKESMKPYIIGAVLLFSITNILGIISDIF